MKILHTADWHIGHRLHERSQFEEQTLFFDFLLKTISKNKIDILLISGDIFDTTTPSSQSQKMYYDLLVKINNTCCKHIVITGGNHDSPSLLNAPKLILEALQINIVAKACENVEDEIFDYNIDKQHVVIAAVPFLRDQDIRRAIEGENFTDISTRYKLALKNHYNEVAVYCKKKKKENSIVIAMGHLFAAGGIESDSEKDIYIGGLSHISANDFSDVFDYVALGHLHRQQLVAEKNYIRYSGSPLVYSFSEVQKQKATNNKMLLILNIEQGKILEIEEHIIPKFRIVKSYKGNIQHCIKKLKTFENNEFNLTPWVEIALAEDKNIAMHISELNIIASEENIDILKISLVKDKETEKKNELNSLAKNVKQLKPLDVFKMKCEEQNVDLEEEKELLLAFNSILQTIENKEI